MFTQTRTMKRTLLAISSLFLTVWGFSQTTNLGGPISWKQGVKTYAPIPKQTMPGFDLEAIKAEDEINDAQKIGPWRFGYKYETNFSLDNSGVWEDLPDGGRLWRIGLECPGAMTINLLLDNVHIPDGAQLYLFDKDNTNRVGAYTSRNNREDGELGTELVHGDHIIVEYYEPAEVLGQGSLNIMSVVHGYRSLQRAQEILMKGLNDSGSCNIDVNCPLGDLWGNQIRSVALIVVGGSGACTGALINNTCNDGTPYFLTANHCLGGSTGFWAFRFNWESPEGTESCATTANSSTSSYDQTSNGATVLVSGTQADHALLEIDNMTQQDAIDYGAFYAGWNNDDTESAVTEVIGIHHPSGDVKKICRADDAGNNISHQNAGGASVWYMDSWNEGVTEPGSSGSPLFDQEGRIIGQLFGGAAACSGTSNNGQYDFYGRLGVSWGLGIGTYLAPTACGTGTSNYGYDPNPATVSTPGPVQKLIFTVSPNPSNGIFNVALENAENGDIIVMDMTGRVVYQKDIQDAGHVVNLSDLAGGSYVLRVNTSVGTATQTIVINR